MVARATNAMVTAQKKNDRNQRTTNIAELKTADGSDNDDDTDGVAITSASAAVVPLRQ